ncbi:recombinase family protein [Domibacillus robiginosus]|uniref:recombinase family protein n=1 Tax=Domibacillus robiginosus TaxID=1071054 RepID=UPI00067D0B5D|nr:recombinase family protein [Domibacillus robiginosus]
MTVFGYVRVKSMDQYEDRQLDKMYARGVKERNLYIDKAGGKDSNRPEYAVLRRALQESDLVYIDTLDHLGRNYDAVIDEWRYITREIGADIIVLENEVLFDSRKFREMGEAGKLMENQFLSLLAYIAEQERKKIRQHQREGVDYEKKAGKHLGRPVEELTDEQHKIWTDVYPRWKDGQVKATEFMRLLDVKKTKFYRLVRQYEEREASAEE